MSRLITYLGRFAAILFGFFCASLAASAFLHLLLWGLMGVSGEAMSRLASGPALFSVPFIALFIGYFAFVPALPFILIAELLGKRDWLFHALSGGGVSLIIVGFHLTITIAADRTADPFAASLFVGTGLVAGIAYWAAAGRNAGVWLHGPDEASAQGPSVS